MKKETEQKGKKDNVPCHSNVPLSLSSYCCFGDRCKVNNWQLWKQMTIMMIPLLFPYSSCWF